LRRCILIAAAMLSACSQADDRICESYDQNMPAADAKRHDTLQTAYDVKRCVHRWSFRLAQAEGSISDVAQAVVEACREPIGNHALAIGAENLKAAQNGTPTTSDALEVIEANAKATATFYVTMARAGHCKIP